MITQATHPSVSLVNYGVGNLGSLRNMFRRLGIQTEDLTAPDQLQRASRVLLPGVGAFDHGMAALRDGDWVDSIRQHVSTGKPLLGICLGMQLLLDSSEEGQLPGLGFVPGIVRRFRPTTNLRVPHMGWNFVSSAIQNKLFTNLDKDSRFYFVHSYYAEPKHEANVLTTTHYGHSFASAIVSENVYGTQFHPEKSHSFGMKLLENFSKL